MDSQARLMSVSSSSVMSLSLFRERQELRPARSSVSSVSSQSGSWDVMAWSELMMLSLGP